jgi:hypothetical protein
LFYNDYLVWNIKSSYSASATKQGMMATAQQFGVEAFKIFMH